VDAFHDEFNERVKARFPSCWDLVVMLIPWTQYIEMLLEAKIKGNSSHEKIAALKGKTMVNYLKKEFQLLGLVKTLFFLKLDYTGVTNLTIVYQGASSFSILLCSRSSTQRRCLHNFFTMNKVIVDHVNHDTLIFCFM